MVRPYAVKGGVKRKKREEVYDDEEIEATISTLENNDYKEEKKEKEEEIDTEDTTMESQLAGIPMAPSSSSSDKKPKSGIVFVLERASLEVGKVGKTYQLLNSDEHSNFLKKHGKNPADYRPDIAHQALLAILDSPLNKAGRLQAVYVKTEKGVLFEVKPHCRMPRTFKRFCGIMLQLLQKLSITATGKREKLLRVIANPVTRHLPLNSRKIGLSHSSSKLVQLREYVNAASDDMNLVFVVGAMSHGKISNDYTDDFISGNLLSFHIVHSSVPISHSADLQCLLDLLTGAVKMSWLLCSITHRCATPRNCSVV
ncbi:hypothetical protein MKW94_018586 [Papaver nudicaule]|uniref:Ribosomal RNA small subunit methyltransferase NEP1 n=1 Tax=Papaver nudicaule TaxID=74823 RepID=A0AA41SH68_PAPNU|nr:hypothetical protein [Papaver nudicaule]